MKFSRSYSNPESCAAVDFARFFDFRYSFTTLATISFSSWNSYRRFLALRKRTQPDPPPRTVDQFNFVALDCACIHLHQLISCPCPCRGNTGRSLFLFFCWHPILRFSGPGLNLCSVLTCRIVCFRWMDSFFLVLVIYFTLRMKMSSAVSRISQNSNIPTSPWIAESKPWMISHLGVKIPLD